MEAKHFGVTFPQLLCIVFVVLKLTGVIAWSWWWVTSPLWIMFLVIIILGILICLMKQ
ncbi:MAG: hypothetical protein BWY31_04368 [Lentisphaerae bacterium ADurb.Bin242]|nr:MAG: hypothetical protein BWY31_04368 [Lentisphaerae bacterium ADurb.Bin242]